MSVIDEVMGDIRVEMIITMSRESKLLIFMEMMKT